MAKVRIEKYDAEIDAEWCGDVLEISTTFHMPHGPIRISVGIRELEALKLLQRLHKITKARVLREKGGAR